MLMTNKELMINAAIKHFESERDLAVANAQIYLDKPTGIGEHGNVVQEFTTQVKKAAEAQDALDMVLDMFAEDHDYD
jgi:RNA binding exosome subunit